MTFQFAPDTSRDLVVALLAISTNGSSNSLLESPMLSFIDSTISQIWLPKTSCQRFQEAFNLTYNEQLNLYVIDDSVHQTLLAQNATISFTLSNDLTVSSSSTTITLDLPYSAFDLQLTADYPGITNSTYYFPIRQAANESQYTLGRTFFQHAYVIADYERSTFSVHQAIFPSGGTQQSLHPILPVNNSNGTNATTSISLNNSSGSKLSPGALAGVIIGSIVAALGLIAMGLWAYRKQKVKKQAQEPLSLPEKTTQPELDSKDQLGARAWELHESSSPTPELADKSRVRNASEIGGPDVARELAAYPVGAELDHSSSNDKSLVQRWEIPG